MRIAVSSLIALPAAIAKWQPDAVVSLYSPRRPLALAWMGPLLSLPMVDVETSPPVRPTSRPVAPHLARPVRGHVLALAAFMERHLPNPGVRRGKDGPEPKLLIHCTAGLGRSPAMAIVAAIIDGHEPAEACAMVAGAAPAASPNRLLLRHCEGVYGVSIVPHAERSFTYRRGPAGAQGDVTGWAELGIGSTTPLRGSSLGGGHAL